MLVQILVDNIDSWIVPYARELAKEIEERGYKSRVLHSHQEVIEGDVLCLLSCERIFKKLGLNDCNLVIHESDLPKGKGWSPVSWQVLEGENRIPVTLFEASEQIDAGPIYDQKFIELEGHELIDEIRHQQGRLTKDLILAFIKNYPHNYGKEQKGEPSFYPKRTPQDSELNSDRSLRAQLNLLRICDNERYPAFFYVDGHKYVLKISKEK